MSKSLHRQWSGVMKRLGWGMAIVLVPLLLLGWSSVQQWRVDVAQEKAHIIRQWLAAPDEALLQRLPSAERNPMIRLADRREAFQRQLDQSDADRVWMGMRKVMATLSGWLALGALLAGVGAWLKVRIDAWRALRSWHFLQQRMASGWQTLGRCLAAYMSLLASSLGLLLLYEVSSGLSHRADGGLTVLVIVLPLTSVLFVCIRFIWRLRQQWSLMQASSATFLGRSLSPEAAPVLWRWIEGLAAKLQAPVPDHIVVGLDQSFFVTSVPIVLQPSGPTLTGRTLYLPLACLGALSQAEAASVIGHELGHFKQRDTEQASEISARFSIMCSHYSAIVGAERTPPWIERPALWMAGQFLHHFQVAVHHWGRGQELLADRAGAEVGGSRLFVQALLRVIALDRVIDRLLVSRGGQNLVQDLALYLQRAPLELGEEVLELASTHPFDTHPATVKRMHSLNVMLDADLLQTAMRTPTAEDQQWFNRLCRRAGCEADGAVPAHH